MLLTHVNIVTRENSIPATVEDVAPKQAHATAAPLPLTLVLHVKGLPKISFKRVIKCKTHNLKRCMMNGTQLKDKSSKSLLCKRLMN